MIIKLKNTSKFNWYVTKGIREHLKLNKPIYVPTSAYGHFGRNPNEGIEGSFTWEKTDLVEAILKEV